jgi:hypothetical protein
VLSPESGLSWSAAVAARLEAGEHDRSAAHARQLRDGLELLRLDELDGFELSMPAELALLLRCSEHRAVELLPQAELFAALPEGLVALEAGRLTVEQARAVSQSRRTSRSRRGRRCGAGCSSSSTSTRRAEWSGRHSGSTSSWAG